jgi:hypothetical protein
MLDLRAAHHVEGPDDVGAGEEGDADQRGVADPAAHLLVDAGIGARVLDQERLAALDRVAGDRLGDGAPRAAHLGGAAAGRARVEEVTLDQVDHRPIGADDGRRALGDDLHDALQVVARGGDGLLRFEDQRQALI